MSIWKELLKCIEPNDEDNAALFALTLINGILQTKGMNVCSLCCILYV